MSLIPSLTPQQLFNRAWQVSIGPAAGSNLPGVSPSGGLGAIGSLSNILPGQGLSYNSLRVVFDIEKINVSVSNKAKISIYNLSEKSRQFFQSGMQIQLQAGYQGLMETLYIGDIVQNGVKSKREGPSIVTTFECGDAEKNLNMAHFDKSYPKGTMFYQVIQDLAQALGVAGVGVVIGLPNYVFDTGFATSGTVADALDQLLDNEDLEWSIHNGTLNIIPRDKHLGDEAIVISQETGMIGLPTKGDIFTSVDSLLNPKIVPGCLVQIVSNTINDFFKVQKAHFKGDSHGNDWSVTAECFKIDAIQTESMNQGFNFLPAVKAF